MAYLRYWAVVLLLLQVVSLGYGEEEQSGEAGATGVGHNEVTDDLSALEYLTAYNWLPTNGSASELIVSASLYRNFQMYAGLPVTGILDQATIAKMNSPRCGNPDFGSGGYQQSETRRKRFNLLGRSWSQTEITWYLQGTTSDLSRYVIRMELATAFQYWAAVSALTFREVFTTDADILVDFFTLDHMDNNPFDGPGNVLAHAFGPGRGIGGDIHFDDDETFSAGEGINFQQVAVHEIGHSLGLSHSSELSAIMTPFYRYRAVDFQLGQDDIAGIQSLYGPPRNNPTTRSPVSCNGQFDAAVGSFDDGAAYLFQGSDVYKVTRNFAIESGYPRPISVEFPGAGIPSFIDAALLWTMNAQDKCMYMFKGNQYWGVCNGIASPEYPRLISDWGLPGSIDGAFRWPGDNEFYFFKGDEYYLYNTTSYGVDPGYPLPLQSSWTGVIFPLSAVLDFDGQSYFFNGQYFQIFNTDSSRASANFQAAGTWLGSRGC